MSDAEIPSHFKDHTKIDPLWRSKLPRTFFGEEANGFVDIVENLLRNIGFGIYKFEKSIDIDKINVQEKLRRYWVNTLYHANIVAVSGMMRSWFWAESVLREGLSVNVLAWASCMRALIESAGDASYSLLPVPVTLSKNHKKIQEALAGISHSPFPIATDINDLLKHFTFADKNMGLRDKKFAALPPTKYVEILAEHGVYRVKDAYADLCGLTHPASRSIQWMRETKGDFVKIEINEFAQGKMIYDLMTEYEVTFHEVFMSAINPSLCTLKVIRNISGDECLRVMDSVDLEALPIWKIIVENFNQ